MRTKEDIIQAIRSNDRSNKVYIHPVLPPEKAARYLSAFSNENGGDIILGIEDDGQTLRVKNYPIPFKIENALKLLNVDVNCITESFQVGDNNLIFISIDKSKDLVKVNDIPYIINQDGELVELKTKKVFLSYCHNDADLANIVEESLSKHNDISVSRDININQYRDDLDKFMKTIRDHDYVVSIVTSKYLKSLNCMYEITELMKDSDFNEKLLFIIVDRDDAEFYKKENIYTDFEAGIYEYNKRLSYTTFWYNKGREMEESFKSANLPPVMTTELTIELSKVQSVIPSTNKFMDLLKNKIGKSFKEISENDFKTIVEIIKE